MGGIQARWTVIAAGVSRTLTAKVTRCDCRGSQVLPKRAAAAAAVQCDVDVADASAYRFGASQVCCAGEKVDGAWSIGVLLVIVRRAR